jgi:hypothetical protein
MAGCMITTIDLEDRKVRVLPSICCIPPYEVSVACARSGSLASGLLPLPFRFHLFDSGVLEGKHDIVFRYVNC